MKVRDIVFQPLRAMPFALPNALRRFVFAGTKGMAEKDRRSLAVANVTGYLGSLSSLSFALSFSLIDFQSLRAAVIGNLLSAFATAMTPFVHRFGRSASALYLSFVFYVSLFFFVSVLGRNAGVQLNYIAASAIVVTILGVERYRLAIFLVAIGLVLHLAAWFSFPVGAATEAVTDELMTQLYVQSATTIMIILGVVVFYILRLVDTAQARTDALLLNMMPASIAARLMESPEEPIAENYEETTIMFADLCGFTSLSAEMGAQKIVTLLDEMFSIFDSLAVKYGVEKIKTIGDAYMVAAGAPERREDHAEAVAALALEIVRETEKLAIKTGRRLSVRIGIESGPVMGGVIGRSKFAYDVWGETVNIAARLEPLAAPGEIIVGDAAQSLLRDRYKFEALAPLELRGIGPYKAWKLVRPA